jgi:hypothetical protein
VGKRTWEDFLAEQLSSNGADRTTSRMMTHHLQQSRSASSLPQA